VKRLVQDLLAQWQCGNLELRPYCPGMSTCDFDLFTKIKEPLLGQAVSQCERGNGGSRVDSLMSIKRNKSTHVICHLPQISDKADCMVGDCLEGV
jgi:hypothetical protein